MSLQVWLPLTKDLRNQGLANSTVTNGGATYSSSGGKLGGCYVFDGTDDAIGIGDLSTLVSTDFTFACWFYHDDTWSSKSWETILGGPSGFELEMKNSTTNSPCVYLYSWGKGNFTYDLNTWNHLVMTRNSTETKVYLNGELKLTGSAGTIPSGDYFVGAWKTSAQQNYKGKINDVRIYDHCLSTEEVKRISQGLVLHYSLNNNGTVMNYSEIGNLIPNSKTMALGTASSTTGTWRLAGTSNMTQKRVLVQDSPIGECYAFQNEGIQTANDGSCYGIDSTTYFEPNSEYRISMFARIVSGSEGYAGYNIYNISEELGGSHTKIEKNYRVTPLNSDGSWTYCWYHIKTNSSATRNIYIGITTGSSSVTTQMCLVRIDKWSESMGSNIEYDSSGFCNNGIKDSSLLYTSNTPKYSVSTQFNGAEVITANSLPLETLTIACWVRVVTIPSGYGIIYVDTNTQTALGFYNGNSFITSCITSANLAMLGSTFQANEWNHLVLVKTGTNTRNVYCNGQLLTNSSSNSWTHQGNNLQLGKREYSGGNAGYLNGQMCDFRAYTTALSADDVKSLYQNEAAFDDQGNILGPIR